MADAVRKGDAAARSRRTSLCSSRPRRAVMDFAAMAQSDRSKALAQVLFQQGMALERAGRAAEADGPYARALRQDRG